MKSLILALLILSIFSMTCKAQSKQNRDLEEAKKAIEKYNAIHFSSFAKNDGSILNLYAEDACLLMPNKPAICGREELLKFFNGAYEAGARDGKIKTLNIYGDGQEYVTEEGLAQVFDGNGKMLGEGKYIVIWKKTKDGWKMFRDMFNSDH